MFLTAFTDRYGKKDITDIKETLSNISKDLKKLTEDSKKNQDTISSLLNKITSLESSVAIKDEKFGKLEARVNELEQYSRSDNLVISGLRATDGRTWASVTKLPSEEELQENTESADDDALETRVLSLFSDMGLDVEESNISAMHFLPKGTGKLHGTLWLDSQTGKQSSKWC